MKLELVGEWKTVLLKSYASLLGIAAFALGLLGIATQYIGMLQSTVSPLTFFVLSVACTGLVPYARVVKQEQLRILTGAANPQPVTAPPQAETK